LWDTRNALRLCDQCHAAHHNRTHPVPASALTESNIDYVFEVYGACYGSDYLRRRYDLRGGHPRIS
jgi:hypothetical protein